MKRRKSRSKKPLLLLSLLFIGVSIPVSFYVWTSASQENPIASRRGEETSNVIYPVLYSDKHITQNAIVSDPRFKNTISFNRESSLANVSSSILKNGQEIKAAETENGTWLWTPILDITPNYRSEIISGAKKNGIRNIYLSVDSYLDIYVMPDGPEKNKKKKIFDETIESFISEAHKNNMTVDAEAGWRNWAEPGHEYKAFAVIDYAIEYNSAHSEKFRGFQYDIEPYMLPSYQEDKTTVLYNLVRLVNETVTRLNNSDLELSVTIPEFYDGSREETPRYFYGLQLGYTLDHLLRVLDRRPGSKILVMAYRNFAEGKDGAIEISQDEIGTANKYQTKIIIAQETGDVSPSYVTFHNTSRSRYNTELQTIENTFSKEQSYGGVATHYINALLALR